MKKILIGATASLGVVSSILALIDALPQYNAVFLVLIGITVGYALGSFTPDNTPKEKMSEHSKGILLVIIMFTVPPFIILLGIVVIWLIGFMTDLLIQYILGWSIFILVASYIIAGIVSYYWAKALQANNRAQNKDSHDNQPNDNAD